MRRVGTAAIVAGMVAWGCGPMVGGGGRGPGGPGGPGMDPLHTEYLNSGTANGIPGFTQAVRVGQMVYISGQVALDDEGLVVGAGDLRAQAAQVYANLTRTLASAGAVPSEVVKLTYYVVNLKPDDLAMLQELGSKFLPPRRLPAGVMVGISALPRDSLLLAIDAVAIVRAEFRERP